MLLHYQSDFHPDLANLSKRLRCLLGTSVTTYQCLTDKRHDHFCHGLYVAIKIGLYYIPPS